MMTQEQVATQSPVEPQIEEIQDESHSHDHNGHDHHHDHDHEHAMVAEHSERQQSRTEKKVRKALSKLGLKKITGIQRVVLKRPKGVLFTLSQPDVFKSAVADTYVVFGEARIEDMSGASQAQAAQNFMAEGNSSAAAEAVQALAGEGASKDEDVPELEEVEEDNGAPVDESGIEAKDIELVMKNASVSRSKAVQALRNNNNDIVNAIMELSM
ncbi:hypothetical protein MP228_007978 [Amoeboaphelidium protococcarum]|nr:hypothetical protein MP228_007978 [Amoeboaphelidium protococcarum]